MTDSFYLLRHYAEFTYTLDKVAQSPEYAGMIGNKIEMCDLYRLVIKYRDQEKWIPKSLLSLGQHLIKTKEQLYERYGISIKKIFSVRLSRFQNFLIITRPFDTSLQPAALPEKVVKVRRKKRNLDKFGIMIDGKWCSKSTRRE
jgi:hypothetical protein